MTNHGIFPVSEFAKLSKMTRDILLNYDRAGLLSPVVRGKNNYRYYSSDQLPIANMIRMNLESGIPLAKIKRMNDGRTPENTAEALARQIDWFNRKMKELDSSRKLAETLRKSILSVRGIDEQAITVRSLPEEPILLGGVNDYGNGRDDYDALRDFYTDMGERHPDANLGYPVWALFSEERIRRRDWKMPDRYYFYNPEGGDRRPAAHYAVGYTRGGYGQAGDLYERLLAYIDGNDFEICGDAYEEYPLNELCVSDSGRYLIRVMIAVRKKASNSGTCPARRQLPAGGGHRQTIVRAHGQHYPAQSGARLPFQFEEVLRDAVSSAP